MSWRLEIGSILVISENDTDDRSSPSVLQARAADLYFLGMKGRKHCPNGGKQARAHKRSDIIASEGRKDKSG